MRVTVVTSLYPSAPRPHEGIFAQARWSRMHARGHDVRVVHPRPLAPPRLLCRLLGLPAHWRELAGLEARELRAGIEVVRPRYVHLPGRAVGNARRFAAAALRDVGKPDVVVCDYAWPAAAIAPRLRQLGIACVINGRGSDVLQVAGEAGLGSELARYLRAAGFWCAVSDDLVAAMDQLAGAPGHGRLVPNGVDRDVFHPRPRAAARSTLGLSADVPLVLVVGHLIERKQPLLALEVFGRAAPADARLVFVGSGALVAAVREAIDVAGLRERVSLVGECAPAELATWLAACDLLLLTSRREGRPNVVLEALACARPVLATDVGGTRELLGEGPMLARAGDAEDLSARLAALLRQAPGEDELLARVASLSWEASCAALEACLSAAREGAAA